MAKRKIFLLKEGCLNSGNYVRYFQIDKKVYWSHENSLKQEFTCETAGESTLPSSSVKREEIGMIKEGKFKEADEWDYKDIRPTRGTI